MFNRRCGVLSFVVLAILVFLVCAPVALPQAVTMVQSSARSAGSSAFGYNGDFGPATTVNLSNPSYMVFDSNGNQFVSDTLNNCVRKIDTAGNITTVAGLAVSGQSDTCNSCAGCDPAPDSDAGPLPANRPGNRQHQPPLHRGQRPQLRPRLGQRRQRRCKPDHRRRHLRLSSHCIRHPRAQRSGHRRCQQPLHLHTGLRQRHPGQSGCAARPCNRRHQRLPGGRRGFG